METSESIAWIRGYIENEFELSPCFRIEPRQLRLLYEIQTKAQPVGGSGRFSPQLLVDRKAAAATCLFAACLRREQIYYS